MSLHVDPIFWPPTTLGLATSTHVVAPGVELRVEDFLISFAHVPIAHSPASSVRRGTRANASFNFLNDIKILFALLSLFPSHDEKTKIK